MISFKKNTLKYRFNYQTINYNTNLMLFSNKTLSLKIKITFISFHNH